MTHQKNLKVIVFVGSDAEQAVDYLTENHFPKVSAENIVEQVEHLVGAGQHRVVTNAILDAEGYKELAHEFPGELYLVTVGSASDELGRMTHHHITSEPKVIDALLEELDFKL